MIEGAGVLRVGTRECVVVGNPGAVPEMAPMAAGLAQAGLLRTFVLPIDESFVLNHPATQALPGRAARALRHEAARRCLPVAIPRDRVRYEATSAEALFVAAQRAKAPEPVLTRLLNRRNHRFDRQLSRHVRWEDGCVVATRGAALETFRRARQLGVPGILSSAIAHHRFSERLLGEEARLQPLFAATLYALSYPAAEIARFDAEIEAADRIFVLSSFHARTFEEAGVDRAKLVVTPLGVDLELYRPGRRGDDGRFRVLFVGQIGQRKGLSYLLEAAKLAGIPNLELVLAGNPVGEDATWRGLPGVRHAPHRPRTELPALYATADVYVLPSLVEGFPLTALEAMACGLPVIVSENTFGRDVVTDGVDGFVVPIRDAAAIAERLRYLFEHPGDRRQMGAAARKRAEAFGWEHYGERIAAAVGEIVASTSPRRDLARAG